MLSKFQVANTYFCSSAVPVVFGGHRSDYEAVAPPHSFIHVEDFARDDGWIKSPKEIRETAIRLSTYLNYLISNKTAFAEYFWWKDYYSVEESVHSCSLCSHLTNIKYLNEFSRNIYRKGQKQKYFNFDKYWNNCSSTW
jgi:hypothetical protein